MAPTQRIVVGIDFGTTSTLVAWARTTPPVQIEILRNWPTCGPPVGTFVPTEVSYSDKEGASRFTWGHDIPTKNKKIQWFKLGLEADAEVLTLPAGMTSVDVARDFLAVLYEHIMSTLIRRFNQTALASYDILFHLTVPAIWSDAAKQRTEDAATRAGFSKDALQLLSEPECAAIYALRNVEDLENRVAVHDRILVCDAGGGTVDLISYDIEQIRPRLSIKECVAGTGELCGSTFIDREFEILLKNKLGPHFDSMSRLNRQQIAKNFEAAKQAFRDSPEQPVFYIPMPGLGNVQEAAIVDGNLELTREQMRSLFDPIVERILGLVKEQIELASSGSQKVSSIVLVGGFGESEFLFRRIQKWAAQFDIDVIQPRDARTAIAQGAVIKGLEIDPDYQTEIVRRARRSYGFPTSERFVDGRHSYDDLYIDQHTGERLAMNQISWFIKKTFSKFIYHEHGWSSTVDFLEHRFARDFKPPEVWTHTVVSSDSPTPPSRIEPSVHPHCTIYSDLSGLKSQFTKKRRMFQVYYSVEYSLVMGVQNNNLSAWLEFKGTRYGVENIKFD